MKFKIRKVTYGDNSVSFFPMIKKGFWYKWDYFYLPSLYSFRRIFNCILDAKKHIDFYKREKHDIKITETKDILYD